MKQSLFGIPPSRCGSLTLAHRFRYVELAVPWICQYQKANMIRDTMKDIPKELSGIYQGLFERINEDSLESNRELAWRAISWVFAAQTQLNVNEVIKAVSSGYRKWYEEAVTCDDIITCCHQLLVYKPSSNTIEFSHFSVVQHIEKERMEECSQKKVHSLLSFLCLNAMWESAQVHDRGFKPEPLQSYVDGLTQLTCSSVHNHATGNSQETFMSFWCYETNFWAFHCERSDADSGMDVTWGNPLSLWCGIKQQVKPTAGAHVFLSEPTNVSLGVNSIRHRIPETSAKDVSEWVFMVSCKFKP
jgi:hypothetical protein